jgi:hypothetical protein
LSQLVVEILLRLAKVAAASIVGILVYAVLVGPFGATGSLELAMLAWLVGAAVILLVETSPI